MTTEDRDPATGLPYTQNALGTGGKGLRVAIGGNSSDWYDPNSVAPAGGVAYLGSFVDSTLQPAFVFNKRLANGRPKAVWEASSHEIGHTLGLAHDGTSGVNATGYYAGHNGWAPIMGVGYYQPVSQWSQGQYAAANQLQDDLALMTRTNYLSYRTDDHGGTPATATPLTAGVEAAGNIERSGDVDCFSFAMGGAGNAHFVIALVRRLRTRVCMQPRPRPEHGAALC